MAEISGRVPRDGEIGATPMSPWFRDSVNPSFLWYPKIFGEWISAISEKNPPVSLSCISAVSRAGYASRNHWQRHFLSEGSQLVPLQWGFCELQRWRMVLAMGHLCSCVCLNWLCFFLNRTPKDTQIILRLQPRLPTFFHISTQSIGCVYGVHIKYPLVN